MKDQDRESMALQSCFGKFTYARGSAHILHFMPLKSELFKNSIDYSQLFFLRSLRYRQTSDLEETLSSNEEIARYMGNTAVKLIADCASEFTNLDRSSEKISILEIGSGLGLTFEYLKFLQSSDHQNKYTQSSFSFCAVGDQSDQLTFEIMHADEKKIYDFSYIGELDPAQISVINEVESFLKNFDIVIYNHDCSIRRMYPMPIDWDVFVDCVSRSAILAVRVTSHDQDELKTTVTGYNTILPSLQKVIDYLGLHPLSWKYDFYEKFDENLFLPPHQAKTGLLVAYTT